ncbi:MAG: cytochrome c oxidase subunit 3 family protein [Pirellulales bacterium]|nr:cytochrome c oxidase subunit 3 family protein [Pirellulales bacterium]
MATHVESHAPGDHGADGHGEHGHLPHLAHHFETPEQQFYSGKLGMWLFLVQEVLFFSGLFCAYAVYRRLHPEVFVYAHEYLDVKWGAINTGVLIFSSLTMALGVRAAQLGQRKALIGLLSITIACGFAFMGIKYVEYSHKWHHGVLWGKLYAPDFKPGEEHLAHGEHGASEAGEGEHAETAAASAETAAPAEATAATPAPDAAAAPVDANAPITPATATGSSLAPPGTGPTGTLPPALAATEPHHPPHEPKNVQIFFGIYFCMTGLHGLHVVIGIGVLGWLLWRALRGEFADGYFEPVDFVGLYWHLVDLVWIYLFPLLYLIH